MTIIEFIKNHKKFCGIVIICLGLLTLLLPPDKTTGAIDGTPALMSLFIGAALIFSKE